MTCAHAKVQVQWSVVSEDRVETNGRMETIALPAALMRSVITLRLLYWISFDAVCAQGYNDDEKIIASHGKHAIRPIRFTQSRHRLIRHAV